MADGKDAGQKRIWVIAGIVAAVVAIVALASQSQPQPTETGSSLTARAEGHVVRVIEDSTPRRAADGDTEYQTTYRYEVEYEDEQGNTHVARTISATKGKEHDEGGTVRIRYNPSNPDSGCEIASGQSGTRWTVPKKDGDSGTDDLGTGQATGTDGSPEPESGSDSSGSGSTMAQRWLNSDPDSGSGDAISDITGIGRRR